MFPTTANLLNASLEVKLQDGLTVHIPAHELVLPLRGIGRDGTLVLDDSLSELQIAEKPAPDDGLVLGRSFLSQVSNHVPSVQNCRRC